MILMVSACGKAGWGEGGAFITAMSNSFGARWFDEKWNAQFDTREWSDTLNFFVNMMTDSGLPVMPQTALTRIFLCSSKASAVCGSMRQWPLLLSQTRKIQP